MRRFCWMIVGGCLAVGASAAEGPPTKAEAEALLATLRTAAAAKDCAAILAMSSRLSAGTAPCKIHGFASGTCSRIKRSMRG